MRIILFILLSIFSFSAGAITLEKTLPDENQEAQAQSIFKDIRCMVCSGESIADSRADLAGNLRAIIRQKVSEGQSALQIRDYLVSRYGQEVLMQPPVNSGTYLLWAAPFVILISGIIIIVLLFRKKS